MNNINKPTARFADLITQDMPDETLVYDIKSKQAHCLNRSASIIWKNCDGTNTIDDLVGILKSEADLDAQRETVLYAIGQLSDSGLLDQNELQDPNLLGRRELIRKAGIAAAIALPLVSSIAVPTNVWASTSGLPSGSPCSSSIECQSGVCIGSPGTCV